MNGLRYHGRWSIDGNPEIEICSLEDLVLFCGKYGSVVLCADRTMEIYDDYMASLGFPECIKCGLHKENYKLCKNGHVMCDEDYGNGKRCIACRK